jgi:hypothetical protein
MRHRALGRAAADARAAAAGIQCDLVAARARATDGSLELELDCPAADCPVIQTRIHAREIANRLGAALRCPACGRQLVARYVVPAAEANAAHQAWAHALVNRELYVARERARLGDPAAVVDVPADVLIDTRLPGATP